jgi:RND family efflux transporter MFP subunit
MRKYDLERIFAVIAVSLLLAGCGENGTKSQAPAQVVTAKSADAEVGPVTGQPYVEKLELPAASVHGFETTRLESKIGGYVGEIKKVGDREIDIGMMVEKGTELAVLEVPEMMDELNKQKALVQDAKSKVDQAEASIQQAKAGRNRRDAEVLQAAASRKEKIALLQYHETKYGRVSGLAKSGSVGTDVLDEAKYESQAAEAAVVSAQAGVTTAKADVLAAKANIKKAEADKKRAEEGVKVAQAELAKLRTMIKYLTITAPYKGIISQRMVHHGTFVRPATSNSSAMPLFEIVRIDKVRVVVSVPNDQAGKIRRGQKAIFHNIGGLPGIAVEGVVSRSAEVYHQKSRMLQIQIDFENPATDSHTGEPVFLKPGMFGRVDVTVNAWDSENLLPVVPATAVGTDESGRSYVVVVKNGANQRRNVELAFNDAIQVGISKGVKIGERVVLKDVGKY